MKVLYLTPWYPSPHDQMVGLFVQKHVEAVQAQGVDVRVICSQGWRDMWRQWRELKHSWGLPDVVQLNVIQKQGLLALWLKKRYRIPFVIIEHWTGYLPENMSVKQYGWHTRMMKQICREAEVVMPVSEHLGKAMQALGFTTKRWEKVNNVVDDFFFQKSEIRNQKSEITTFLNITCFDEPHKNVKSLLRAAKILSEKHSGWQLVLVGTGADYAEVRAYADTLSLPEGMVVWTGELTPRQVSDTFNKADVFVLTSRFENAPVVISESIVKGVPVISTRVGGIPEMVNEGNGLLVSPDSDAELVQAMEYMLTHHTDFNRDVIRRAGDQYSYAAVGRHLKAIYESVLTSAQ